MASTSAAQVRADGSVAETLTVRWKEPDGRKPRRTFDTLQRTRSTTRPKRQTAKRWRPEELRQERAGRRTLAESFEEWWLSHGLVELKRLTLKTYRLPVEAHASPRLGEYALRDIDARKP